MDKLIIVLMTLLPSWAFADSLGVVHSTYESDRVDGLFSVQYKTDSGLYAWAGYEIAMADRITQRLGRLETLSAGAGYRVGGVFVEFGYYHPKVETRIRTLSEIIYHSFTPTFGIPPFNPANGFYGMEYSYKLKPALGTRIGIEHSITEHISIQASYRALSFNEKFQMWNGTPDPANLDACGCLWQGEHNWKMNTVEFGIFYHF